MVYVLLGNGFEEIEALTAVDLLRRAGYAVLTVGQETVTGGHGIPVGTDIRIEQMDLTNLEMIVLPGGLGGVAAIRACPAALDAVRFAWSNDKWVAAICAAPTILAELGISDGRRVTCYPGCEGKMGNAVVDGTVPCVRDGRLITGASAGCAVPFALELIRALGGNAETIADEIVIRRQEGF